MIRRTVLIVMSMGVLLYGALTKEQTGEVVDSITGLIWQDSYLDNDKVIKQATWQEALIYCQELQLGNSNRWRLPNIVELKSIRATYAIKPAIDKTFQNTTPDFYWSSTTPIRNTANVWGVSFYEGLSAEKSKTEVGSVRCVRGAE